MVEECGEQLKVGVIRLNFNSSKRLWWLKKRLVRVRKMVQSTTVVEELRQVEADVRKIRHDYRTSVWQRCCPFVLRDGYKNTSYFHTKMAARRKQNRLNSLKDRAGILQTTPEAMRQVVTCYFKDLFSSSRPPIFMGQ